MFNLDTASFHFFYNGTQPCYDNLGACLFALICTLICGFWEFGNLMEWKHRKATTVEQRCGNKLITRTLFWALQFVHSELYGPTKSETEPEYLHPPEIDSFCFWLQRMGATINLSLQSHNDKASVKTTLDLDLSPNHLKNLKGSKLCQDLPLVKLPHKFIQ